MHTRDRPASVLGRVLGPVVGAALLLVLVALAGCAGEQPTASSPDQHELDAQSSAGHGTGDDGRDDGGGMAAMPGMATLPAPPESSDWNVADATYLTMMIPHHRQALDLADLAATRADDRRVRAIASSIDRGQGREIVVMATWLVDHGLPEPTLDDVEEMYAAAGSPSGMSGMLSPDQVDTLAAADGTEFDRLFLEGMIQHHQGAVAMAEDLLAGGEDVRVTEMATDVIATQSGEIARMRDLLADLS